MPKRRRLHSSNSIASGSRSRVCTSPAGIRRAISSASAPVPPPTSHTTEWVRGRRWASSITRSSIGVGLKPGAPSNTLSGRPGVTKSH